MVVVVVVVVMVVVTVAAAVVVVAVAVAVVVVVVVAVVAAAAAVVTVVAVVGTGQTTKTAARHGGGGGAAGGTGGQRRRASARRHQARGVGRGVRVEQSTDTREFGFVARSWHSSRPSTYPRRPCGPGPRGPSRRAGGCRGPRRSRWASPRRPWHRPGRPCFRYDGRSAAGRLKRRASGDGAR